MAWNITLTQDSPPAWTQEAYCPWCILFHSVSCSGGRGGVGVPYPGPGWREGRGGRYPVLVLAGGSGGVGYPALVLAEGVGEVRWVPCPGPGWAGGLGWGVPCPGPGWSAPSSLWTDTHLWKLYLPHPSDVGGNFLLSSRSNVMFSKTTIQWIWCLFP